MSSTFSDNFMTDEKNRAFLQETMWGPNGIRQAEELASHLPLEENMRILDLGCGLGLSPLYLVRKHDVQVFATDLYADPSENYKRFQSLDIADKAIPMMLDATQALPFAKGYFDVIFSVGTYNLFGDTEDALSSFIPYVKKGGYIAVSIPGLKRDFGDNVPAEMQVFWDVPDVARCIRGIDWWKDLWSKARGVEIVTISEMKCHDLAWEEYLASRDPKVKDQKWDLDMMAAEGGKYYNTIQMIARVI